MSVLPTAFRADPAPGQGMGAPARRPSLLLVEDDLINQMVADALLKSLGYADVEIAANGQEALALCIARPFDLVLMDCLMPVMGGLEATRQLRARGLRMPVIALTGSTTADEIDRCLEAGMDGHLPKPIDVQRLAATLALWLGTMRTLAPALN